MACGALAIHAALGWSQPGAALRLGGGLAYLLGTFLVTIVANVPRNDALAALDPGSVNAAAEWMRYLSDWTTWNHVRTVAAVGAAALLTITTRIGAPPGGVPALLRERTLSGQRLAQRRMTISSASRAVPPVARHTERPPYSEVPPERLNQDVVELFPESDGARAVAYLNDTVVFQIRRDFESDWEAELDQAARYACGNVQRFVLDVRGNLGGFVRRLEHLAHYFRATEASVPSSVMVHRELVNAPMRNELRALSEQLSVLGFPPCTLGHEAECFLAIPSGELLTDPGWYLDSRLERRGHALERVSPQVTYAGYTKEDFVIPCPGKFVGKNLLVLMNGLNTSAGFFGPELLRGLGTLVVQGGQAGESMTTGRARGGPTVRSSAFSADYDFLVQTLGVTPRFDLPALPRPVEFRLEYDGAYRADLRTLHLDHPPTGDVQVAFWSNSSPTAGAAYRAAISAVEIRAVVEPACGPARRAHRCRRYEACAADALHRAVQAGLVSAITAERVLEDLAAQCEE